MKLQTLVGGLMLQSGSAALTIGSDSGSVTGLALGSTPSQVLASVRGPTGGLLLGVLVMNPSTDGFDYALTGAPDASGYYVDYIVVI